MWGISTSRSLSAILISLFCAFGLAAIGAGSVVINEVELNPPGNATKWVELYNGGEEDVDLSGWVVTIKNPPWNGPISIPEGTVIPAGGYYVAEGEEEWGQDYSGTVVLKDSDGITVDETHYMVDESDSDFTSGRYPNGLDTDQKSDWKLMKATPRAENVLSIRS
ncbi:MAG: Lipoprotein, putative [Methanothrix harundinacea]|uniref:Lipoprotein, putative n=1 Tax=Methanothrix harundinacea TaxID=301375 RepID=A0A101IME0_9EURY|nr:MAG: Lipoprotein, putative [Methanothrix harundinacea]KUK97758.1 MAG: Lipoprotein, putative [Methanothrix harundinacea]